MTLVNLSHISNSFSFFILQINATWALNCPQGSEESEDEGWKTNSRDLCWRQKQYFLKGLLHQTTFSGNNVCKKASPLRTKKLHEPRSRKPSYFFSFKPLIKDNQIDKTFIKQPLSKLFGFQFRKDWDGIFVKKSFACYIFSRIVITLTNHGLVDALANT